MRGQKQKMKRRNANEQTNDKEGYVLHIIILYLFTYFVKYTQNSKLGFTVLIKIDLYGRLKRFCNVY